MKPKLILISNLFPSICCFIMTWYFLHLALPFALFLLLVFPLYSISFSKSCSILPSVPLVLVSVLLSALLSRFDVLFECNHGPLATIQPTVLVLSGWQDWLQAMGAFVRGLFSIRGLLEDRCVFFLWLFHHYLRDVSDEEHKAITYATLNQPVDGKIV